MSLASCHTKPDYSPKSLDLNVTYDDVYLIMGQSNASGVSQCSFLQTKHPEIYEEFQEGNSNVLISYDVDDRIEKTYVPTCVGLGHDETYFGPEIGIANRLSKTETSYIIKATWSGSCLMTEYVDASGNQYKYYKRFLPFIKGQLESLTKQGKNPRLKGIFWMQGESDALTNYPNKYSVAMQWFYDYLRADLNDWIYGYFNFVDAYISTRTAWKHADVINRCKDEFASANPNTYCIKTNGEDETAISLYLKGETGEEEDLAHYDASSMLLLGQTVAEYLTK